MIEILRIVASLVLCTLSLGGIIGNWYIFVRQDILKRDDVDPLMPFGPGLFGALGLLIAPIDGVLYFAWIPIIIDPGCFTFVIFFRRIRENSRM